MFGEQPEPPLRPDDNRLPLAFRLKYGTEHFYSESVRTDANGNYQFKGLTNGDYKIFAFSIDTLSPTLDLIEVEVSTTITEKKQVVTAPTLTIVR